MKIFKLPTFKKCNGKNCYDKKGAQTQRHFLKRGVKDLRIYHCEICNCWHLSSKL